MTAVAHYATVTSASPLLVLEDGAATAVPAGRNAAYTPAPGDRVVVTAIELDRRGSKRIWILGKDG